MGFNLAFKGLILYSHLHLDLQSISFIQLSQQKICTHFSSLQYVLHALLIYNLFDLSSK